MGDTGFPKTDLVAKGARVSAYCLGGHVFTGVIEKISNDLIEIDRDGINYAIRTNNIVAFSSSRNDK